MQRPGSRVTRSGSVSTATSVSNSQVPCRTGAPLKTETNPKILSDVAFIEPLDYEKGIPNHPLAIGKILAQEGFHKQKDIVKLGRHRFKILLERKETYPELEKIDLQKYNLKLFAPMSISQTVCFVKDVPKQFNEEEIMRNLSATVPILKVERIKRRAQSDSGELETTRNIKVTFKGSKVPDSVKLYGASRRVELYIFPVKQCLKCWRFGHSQKVCRGKDRCGKCGGEHPQETPCTNGDKCINCGGKHQAGDKQCKERKRRENILNKMRVDRLSYAEAETQYPKTSNGYALLNIDSEEEFLELEDAEEQNERQRRSNSKT